MAALLFLWPWGIRWLSLFEVGCEHIELGLPELSVVRDPRERVAHRDSMERRSAHSTFLLYRCQSRALQHAHVLGDRRKRHRESRRKLADRAVAGGESCEDVAPSGIGESEERVVEGAGTVNHTV
jgi:hypothetical protein